MDNLIFIGGIHGVGKGTICANVCINSHLIHLSSSQVLKWKDISSPQNKLVTDFEFTQDRLIENLKNIVQADKKYLLDGHYCLLDKDGKPERINQKTFELIDPFAFVIVTGNISEIKERLDKRDKVNYNLSLLEHFQLVEMEYAKSLSQILGKPLLVINKESHTKLNEFIKNESFT